MGWTTEWSVTIGGKPVTVNMRPYLMSISIEDKDGSASDRCRLKFDDSGGKLFLPPPKTPIEVTIGGQVAFTGTVNSTPWTLSRGGGRELSINADGIDTRSKVKDGQLWHSDDATLEDVLDKAARKAGLDGIKVSPDLASITRDYWSPDGRSFLSWAQALAREHGATFKVRGKVAVLAKRGEGLSPTGAAMPTIIAAAGRNLHNASIDPSKGRSRFKSKRVRFFDRETESYRDKVVDVALGDGEGEDVIRYTAAGEGEAQKAGEGEKVGAGRDAGSGSVTIELDVSAQAEGTCILQGCRPGIDGTYRITGVRHSLDRSGGSSTELQIGQPQGEAGKDGRATDSRQSPAAPDGSTSVPVPTPAPR